MRRNVYGYKTELVPSIKISTMIKEEFGEIDGCIFPQISVELLKFWFSWRDIISHCNVWCIHSTLKCTSFCCCLYEVFASK